ncbi:unnamed protein product [Orchesella dallaii]|uniref:Complex I assembly factor TIMMDC1, mitochondrial n=1 Tax=Orchesella dallaii TaxID=48710 RepID=A0ABP1QH55_9HEXA
MGSLLSKDDALKAKSLESPYIIRMMEAREKMTGMERLKMVFTVDQYGDVSPEVQRVIHGTMLGVFFGAFFGGLGRGRISYANFFRSNAHEAFSTSLEAKRKLQDTVTLGMGAGAFRIGWRVGLFTGMYMTVSTGVSTFRGKMGILDQVVGGGMAGLLYKIPQGPKATISGGVIGGCLGLTAGIITFGITKLTGTTIDSANMYYYHVMEKKEEKNVVSLQQGRELAYTIDRGFDEDGLTRFHDKMLAELDPSESDEEDLKKTSQTKKASQVQNSESKSEVAKS